MILGCTKIAPADGHLLAAEPDEAAAGDQGVENIALFGIEYDIRDLAELLVLRFLISEPTRTSMRMR